MAETIYSHALTTVSRVKERLGIDSSGFDTVFLRLINAATDQIEQYCERRFKQTTYTDEVYGTSISGGKYLFLRQPQVTTLSALEYRAGTPSTPSWTAFLADDYELIDGGRTGTVRIYGSVPQGENSVRATYIAGYLIDWTEYGTASHTLPADVTEVCEKMVARAFKKREKEHMETENIGESSTTYKVNFTAEDKGTLDKYCRIIFRV